MAFSYTGSALNALVDGLTNNAAPVVTLLNDVKAVLNNGITGTDHLSASAGILNTQLDATTVLDKAGVSSAVVRRGKTNISATESRTNVAYGTLTTPDQIASVVLPTDGLIAVAYQATWQESANGAARAAIFVGANQAKASSHQAGSPVVQEAQTGAASNTIDNTLCTNALGLVSSNVQTYTGDVTTGQLVGLYKSSAGVPSNEAGGGPCYIFASAGTYTISVQFKSSSGSVTAKNRKLWVWTLGF